MIDKNHSQLCELCSKKSITRFDGMYLCVSCLSAYVKNADNNLRSESVLNDAMVDWDFVTRPTREIAHIRLPANSRKTQNAQ